MALIEIKELHLHIDLHGVDKKADKIIIELLKIQNQMAKTKEELKAEFSVMFTEIKDSIANVAADIDRLADSVDPVGGLTEAEAEELLAELRGISATAKATADKTPEEPTEPEA